MSWAGQVPLRLSIYVRSVAEIIEGTFLPYCIYEWDTEVCMSYPQVSLHLVEKTSPYRNDSSHSKCNQANHPCEVPVPGWPSPTSCPGQHMPWGPHQAVLARHFLKPVGHRALGTFKPLQVWARVHRSLTLSIFTNSSYIPLRDLHFPLPLAWLNITVKVSQCRGTFQTHPALLTGVWDSKVPKIFLMPIKIKKRKASHLPRSVSKHPQALPSSPFLACLQPQQLFHISHF